MAQKDVIFGKPGLTVYAAPWRFALTTKLDRLSKQGHRSYDQHDAIVYLHKIVLKRGQPIRGQELKDWAVEFKCTVPSDALIAELAGAYKREFGTQGIS